MQIPDGFRKMEPTDLEQQVLKCTFSLATVGFLFCRAGQSQGPLYAALGMQMQVAANDVFEALMLTLGATREERVHAQLLEALAPFNQGAYAGNPPDLLRDLQGIRNALDAINGKSAAQSAADNLLKRNGGGVDRIARRAA